MSKRTLILLAVIVIAVTVWAARAYLAPEMLMNLLNLRSCGL